jgi:hypothetical protein
MIVININNPSYPKCECGACGAAGPEQPESEPPNKDKRSTRQIAAPLAEAGCRAVARAAHIIHISCELIQLLSCPAPRVKHPAKLNSSFTPLLQWKASGRTEARKGPAPVDAARRLSPAQPLATHVASCRPHTVFWGGGLGGECRLVPARCQARVRPTGRLLFSRSPARPAAAAGGALYGISSTRTWWSPAAVAMRRPSHDKSRP